MESDKDSQRELDISSNSSHQINPQIKIELSQLNFKLDSFSRSLDDMKGLLSKQTEILAQFAIYQDRQTNLTNKVDELEKKLEDMGIIESNIKSISTGMKVAGFFLTIFVAAFGYLFVTVENFKDTTTKTETVMQSSLDSNTKSISRIDNEVWSLGTNPSLKGPGNPSTPPPNPQVP